MSATSARLLAILAGFAAAPAYAAVIDIDISVNSAPTRVFVSGELFNGDEERFAKLTFELENAIVIFNSPGGDVDAGLAIGREIRRRGFATLVPAKYECASACAIAWLGGKLRYMSPKGAIGFHAAYYLVGEDMQERAAPNALVGAYLGQLGLEERAIVFMTSAPPDSMNWLTFNLAENIGLDMLPWEPPRAIASGAGAGTPYAGGSGPPAAGERTGTAAGN